MSALASRPGVLVVDDHGIVRDGLIALLERHNGVQVFGSAASGRDALAAAGRLKPDIVIMDLVLPDMNGIDATERLLNILPSSRVLILTACHNAEHVNRALRAGACGYLVKDAVAQEILEAVNAVRDGKRYISSGVAPADAGERFFAMPKSPPAGARAAGGGDDPLDKLRMTFNARLIEDRARFVAQRDALKARQVPPEAIIAELRNRAHKVRGGAAIFEMRDLTATAAALEEAAIAASVQVGNGEAMVDGPL